MIGGSAPPSSCVPPLQSPSIPHGPPTSLSCLVPMIHSPLHHLPPFCGSPAQRASVCLCVTLSLCSQYSLCLEYASPIFDLANPYLLFKVAHRAPHPSSPSRLGHLLLQHRGPSAVFMTALFPYMGDFAPVSC
jgi:hypothetical protein